MMPTFRGERTLVEWTTRNSDCVRSFVPRPLVLRLITASPALKIGAEQQARRNIPTIFVLDPRFAPSKPLCQVSR